MVTSLLRARGVLRLFEFFKSTFDHRFSRRPWIAFTIFTLALIACDKPKNDDSGATNNTPATTYTLGGNVTGLTGAGLVLQSNDADDKPISVDGNFTFATALAYGTHFSVTVLNQPSGQTCMVQNGNGTIASANITNVTVTCTTNNTGIYTVGGSISGLTGKGLALQNNGGDRKAIAADGNFVFATQLADHAAYDVKVYAQPRGQTCTVQNGSGTTAGANVSNIAITCTAAATINDRVWTTPELMETNDNDTSTAKAVFDKDGNIYVFWMQSNGVAMSLYWRRYDAATAVWRTPEKLNSANSNTTGTPEAGVDGNGNVFVTWIQNDGTANSVFSRRYDATSGTWSASMDHERGADPVLEIAQGVSANGDAIVLWVQHAPNSNADNLWARRYDGTTKKWIGIAGDDLRIDSSVYKSQHPAIAMTTDGNAVVAWKRGSAAKVNLLLANYYDHSQAKWLKTTPDSVSDGTSTADYPSMTMDSSGNVVLVWQQEQLTSTNNDIWANQLTMANYTWGTGKKIETIDGNALFPKEAFDPNGNAIAVWEQEDGSGRYDAWTNRYDHSTGWGNAPTAFTNAVGNPYGVGDTPLLAVDSLGNAVVVYSQSDLSKGKPYSVWQVVYNASVGEWGAAVTHESVSGDAKYGNVISDGASKFMVLWSQKDGTRYNLWFNFLQ